MSDVPVNIPSEGGEVLRQFQLAKDAKGKSDPAWGKAVGKYITMTTFAGIGNGYFWLRNNRFKLNRDMAAGIMNSTKFMDMMGLNSKNNYINLNWQSIKIVNTIVSKMVGKWMGRNEKIVVTATDTLSIKDKEDQYKQARFVMDNRQQLAELEKQSGVRMVPQDQFVPMDKEELDLWMEEYNRLPEEILYEKGENDIIQSNGFFDVNKEKLLWDSAVTGLVVNYTRMDDDGFIHIDWIKPENYFYSYTEYPDFRDCTWMGDIIGMKITEIRKRFGIEFGGTLTEEEIWHIARCSKEYQYYDKLRWYPGWDVAVLRPYDEWNIDVTRYYVKTMDVDPYTLVKTKTNKSTLLIKGKTDKLAENEEFIEDYQCRIYEGYYIQSLEKLLSWGLHKNMISPEGIDQNKAVFPYSAYMYQNNDMRNIAIPEKIQEPAEQMILARYKMQQLVMRMRPTGAAINESALQEIDYGLGDKNKSIDYKKFYDQTGDIYYRGTDAEGNPIPVPITELQNSGFLAQMQGLVQLYQFHYQVLKDELGEDPSISTEAAKPRVAVDNIQFSQAAADEATDYMYDAYLYLMEQTAHKISCLLKTSVGYGAQAYRHLLKESDIKGRTFNSKTQMLPTETEIQRLEAMMANAIQANPDFTVYCDSFRILRIAKEDVKLAELYYRQCMKKMAISKQQQAQQNAQDNAQAQIQSAQAASQSEMQLEQMKGQMKQQSETELSRGRKEEIALSGLFSIWQSGQPVPPALMGVQNEIIENILLPLFAQNQTNRIAIAQANQNMQDAAAMQQQGVGGQPQQGQPNPTQPEQGQPQPNNIQSQPQAA